MICVTGDCHGDFSRFSQVNDKPYANADYIIVCDDFGLLWAKDNDLAVTMAWLSQLPFKILWVQGNHENYDMIAEYPVREWNGGLVRHIVNDRIILLERGQVFTIEGKKFFTFGGARSHDIRGGVFDPKDPKFPQKVLECRMKGLPYRLDRISWWREEMPSYYEIEIAEENLKKVDNKVDYIITHCTATSVQNMLGGSGLYGKDYLTDFFDRVAHETKFKSWYFGHYHVSDVVVLEDQGKRFQCLYEDVVELL